MCGLAGIVRRWAKGESVPEAGSVWLRGSMAGWLAALDRPIVHRGPDGAGMFFDRVVAADGATIDVALVHRRLTILDAAGGGQPKVWPPERDSGPGRNTRERVALVFNGCVYNHRALRRELEGATGSLPAFTSDHSDTEVILRAYQRFGSACVEKLDGMFALAVWDRAKARLMLARDRAGEKPLYAANLMGGRVMAFGSAVPGLVAVGRLIDAREVLALDAVRMVEWIAMGCGERLPFVNISTIAAGTIVTGPGEQGVVREGAEAWRSKRYFSMPTRSHGGRAGEADADALDRLLDSAVASRLEADVPVGCFLSGGIDSGLVTAYARKHAPTIRAFTLRIGEGEYDESPRARMVARRLGVRHQTLECRGSPAEDLQMLIGQLGLPLGDSSILPTYWVARAAREHVKVVLTGDGGDELFYGYRRYFAAEMLRKYAGAWSLVPGGALEAVAGGRARSLWGRAGRMGDAARGRRYLDLLAVFPSAHLAKLMGVARAPAVLDAEEAEVDPARFEFATALPGDLLRKVDTGTMAVALEARSPLLANSVISYGLSASRNVLTLGGRQRKGLLRRLARRYLPVEIVDGGKTGFSVPMESWWRTDHGGIRTMLQDVVGSGAGASGGASGGVGGGVGGGGGFGLVESVVPIDRGAVRGMIDEHVRGARDHSARLFMLLSLAIWSRGLRG